MTHPTTGLSLDMLFPVRCWTCGKVIGHLWDQFNEAFNTARLSGEEVDSLEYVVYDNFLFAFYFLTNKKHSPFFKLKF